MATRRDNSGSAVLDGKLYVFGGGTRNADGYAQATLASVEMYDPVTGLVGAARGHAHRRAGRWRWGPSTGRAQLIGGEPSANPDGTFENNEEYDPANDSWRSLTSMQTPRHGAAAGTINGVIYVAGGGPAKRLLVLNIERGVLICGFAHRPAGSTSACARPRLQATV